MRQDAASMKRDPSAGIHERSVDPDPIAEGGDPAPDQPFLRHLVVVVSACQRHGTGIVVDESTVLTCAHVFRAGDHDGATWDERGYLIAPGGRIIDRTRIQLDRDLDLALVRVPPGQLQGLEPTTFIRGVSSVGPHRRWLLARGRWGAVGFSDRRAAPEVVVPDCEGLHLDAPDLHFKGGVPTGYSGGPVLWSPKKGPVCFGVVRLGGERAGTSRAHLSDTVLDFLARHHTHPREVSVEVVRARSRRRLQLSLAALALLILGVTGLVWQHVRGGEPEAVEPPSADLLRELEGAGYTLNPSLAPPFQPGMILQRTGADARKTAPTILFWPTDCFSKVSTRQLSTPDGLAPGTRFVAAAVGDLSNQLLRGCVEKLAGLIQAGLDPALLEIVVAVVLAPGDDGGGRTRAPGRESNGPAQERMLAYRSRPLEPVYGRGPADER
jgi:hypothetical protein